MFDTLVKEFNASVGKEEGIYVESYSQGSVSDLEEAVNSSLNGEVGAEELPDIFSSYSDTAYAVQQQDKLADLSVYFTEDELSRYVDSYIQEGYFNQDGALYLFPVAKSTEITMINKTDWEPFAEATGTTAVSYTHLIRLAGRYGKWLPYASCNCRESVYKGFFRSRVSVILGAGTEVLFPETGTER